MTTTTADHDSGGAVRCGESFALTEYESLVRIDRVLFYCRFENVIAVFGG